MSAAQQPTTDSAHLQTAQTPPRRATVSDVLRRYGPAFLHAARNQLEPWEARALRELMQCRTADMGGHHWQCSRCGYNHLAYNTCHNRHCAGCGRERRRQWLERVSQWTLPAPYFHLVFTAPHELNNAIRCPSVVATTPDVKMPSIRALGIFLLRGGRRIRAAALNYQPLVWRRRSRLAR